jgi:hypothetical protein
MNRESCHPAHAIRTDTAEPAIIAASKA